MEDTRSQPHTGTPPPVANPPTSGPAATNLAHKWRRGCTPDNLSDVDIVEFTRWRTEKYRDSTRTGSDLSDIFADDFEQFTKETFNQCDSDTLHGLRDLLRSRGVYVRRGRGVRAAKELADLVQKDTQWPEDDPQRPASASPA